MTYKRIILQGVGPLTRSTVSDEIPDPKEEALNDLLHWIWSWKVQFARWRDSSEKDGQGADQLEVRRSCSRASYDQHILAVVGWNLARALKRAEGHFPNILKSLETEQALKLLRHLYEHWDEQRRSFQDKESEKVKSAAEFFKLFPEANPWSIIYTTQDWLLGGVVPLAALTSELEEIEEKALQIERQKGSK